MRITGAHSIIYTKHPGRDRAFFRDVLKLRNVDVGDGWLIFALPPSEVAFHPSKKNNLHEFYLLCDNVKQLVSQLKESGVKCDKVEQQTWGYITKIKLPGGGKVGIYQPLHERPKTVGTKALKRKPPTRKE
jgi:hypothetical protein